MRIELYPWLKHSFETLKQENPYLRLLKSEDPVALVLSECVSSGE